MAWFALSLRTPKALDWTSVETPPTPSSTRYQGTDSRTRKEQEEMYLPRLPARPADIYTVRIFNPSTRPSSLASLKSAVRREGGSVVVDLMDGKGFIFSMPPGSHDPLTGYQHGRLLEEGCIQVTKTTLEKENWRRSVGSSDDDGEVENEEDRRPRSGNGKEHENLRLQWRWTEVKR